MRRSHAATEHKVAVFCMEHQRFAHIGWCSELEMHLWWSIGLVQYLRPVHDATLHQISQNRYIHLIQITESP